MVYSLGYNSLTDVLDKQANWETIFKLPISPPTSCTIHGNIIATHQIDSMMSLWNIRTNKSISKMKFLPSTNVMLLEDHNLLISISSHVFLMDTRTMDITVNILDNPLKDGIWMHNVEMDGNKCLATYNCKKIDSGVTYPCCKLIDLRTTQNVNYEELTQANSDLYSEHGNTISVDINNNMLCVGRDNAIVVHRF